MRLIFVEKMKNIPQLLILILTFLLVGCSRGVPVIPTQAPLLPSKTPTEIYANTGPTPDPNTTVLAYLDDWKAEKYNDMYAMLTKISQDAIKDEDFVSIYSHVATEAALSPDGGIEYQILSVYKAARLAQVNYRVILHSILVGEITRDTVMNLSLENGAWRVQWDDTLILPELKGGNHLSMDYRAPARANIYDRNGQALVAQTDAVAIGLVAAEVKPEDEEKVLQAIYDLMQIQPDSLRAEIETYRQNNWYLPIGDVPAEKFAPQEAVFAGLPGIRYQAFKSRYYFGESIGDGTVSYAAHVTGFRSLIKESEIDYYKRMGYQQSDWVGRTGIERWGEPYLGGKRGGVLYVVNSNGNIVTKLAEANTEPAQAIYSTLDLDLQKGAQQALTGFNGAVIVMERNTGRILAMTSSPTFNPNLFEPENINQSALINALFSANSNNPMLNRATQGQYPLGSVFKIITMSAALISGDYTVDSPYNCTYEFTELPGAVLYDWTWEYYQSDHRTTPSGPLNLSEALMRSCNPFFYHIGLDLYNRGKGTLIAQTARAFGLGSQTGIYGLSSGEEEAGQIIDPDSEVEATIQGIGQGKLQVTPLQVVDFVAAVGNGGKLYHPNLIEKIVPPIGDPSYVFTPTIRGSLPVTGTILQSVQDAMVSVIRDQRGTAWYRFTGFDVPVAGKTGTAQDPPYDPDAWFVAYTFADRTDKPDVAIVVLAEHAGEGSVIAAPIARRILELYFFDKANTTYPWESSIGVVKTAIPAASSPEPPKATATP